MTSPTDRTITSLRSIHDDLAARVTGLTDEQLSEGSGASEWSVAQVLSHLGSGAEIGLATIRAAAAEAPGPDQGFNQSVWDRWNASSPRDQATGFLAHDEKLVTALEALTAEQRQTLQVALGPRPFPLAGYLGMRLNEAAEHSWDVRVALDPDAALPADIAELLAERFATDLGFMLGFSAKADALDEAAVVDIQGSGFAVVIADSVSLTNSPPPATATFAGPLEAAIRLLAGRLTARYTPEDVQVTGNVTLDDLRRVFPGH